MSLLSAAQLEQRADARKMAIVFRKRRQLQRLYTEIQRVRRALLDMGFESDIAGRLPERTTANGQTDVRTACSEAGAALRRCAEAKNRAAIAHRQSETTK